MNFTIHGNKNEYNAIISSENARIIDSEDTNKSSTTGSVEITDNNSIINGNNNEVNVVSNSDSAILTDGNEDISNNTVNINGSDMSGNTHNHHHHHHHNTLIQSAHPISISNEQVSLDNSQNLLLQFDTTNYTYVDLTNVPEDQLPHVDNEGHAHIYLANSTSSNLEDLITNEFKLGRSYDGTYLVSKELFNNYHTFKMVITMNNNMHNPYTNDGVNKVASIINLHYHNNNIMIIE